MYDLEETEGSESGGRSLPAAASEWLDQIVTGPMTAESVEEVMCGFKTALVERALRAELSHYLGYPAGGTKPETTANQLNGSSGKTVLIDDGPLRIDIPRDRAGLFEPQLIGKHERHFSCFDDKIIAMYARRMSVREIQGFLVQMYNTEVSPDFISSVTDAVMEEVLQFQASPSKRCIRWCSSTQDPGGRGGVQQGGVPGPGGPRRR